MRARFKLSVEVVGQGVDQSVIWTSSNNLIATVDTLGSVTAGASVGTVTITATAKADTTKKGTASIAVISPLNSGIAFSISGITDSLFQPVNAASVAGTIYVALNAQAGTIDLFLAPVVNCGSPAIAATDVKAATQAFLNSGVVTLSLNTAAKTATTPSTPMFANGQYCIKAQLTTPTDKLTSANVAFITLSNPTS